jgi:hypothetical protein
LILGFILAEATKPKSARESNSQSVKEIAQSRKNLSKSWTDDDIKCDVSMRLPSGLSKYGVHFERPLDMVEWESNGATIDYLNM